MHIRTIAQTLGGDVSGRQALVPGPGHNPHDRSLSIRVEPGAPDGFVVHSFAGDHPIVCKDYVRERLGLPHWQPGDEQDRRVAPSHVRQFDQTALDRESQKRPRTEDDRLRIERATAIWNEARDPHGTLVEKYLRSRRLELGEDLAGDVLRFHPRTPWHNENSGQTDFIPCLIAAFRSIDDGIITAIHRMRLDQPESWPKIDRRMLGVVHRAAIMLDPIGRELAIGEGLETGMAARQQRGIRPTWALGSTGNIAAFPILNGVRQLTILGETGAASREAIQFCGRRWHDRDRGRRVRVVMPTIGSDLNDELMAAAS